MRDRYEKIRTSKSTLKDWREPPLHGSLHMNPVQLSLVRFNHDLDVKSGLEKKFARVVPCQEMCFFVVLVPTFYTVHYYTITPNLCMYDLYGCCCNYVFVCMYLYSLSLYVCTCMYMYVCTKLERKASGKPKKLKKSKGCQYNKAKPSRITKKTKKTKDFKDKGPIYSYIYILTRRFQVFVKNCTV